MYTLFSTLQAEVGHQNFAWAPEEGDLRKACDVTTIIHRVPYYEKFDVKHHATFLKADM